VCSKLSAYLVKKTNSIIIFHSRWKIWFNFKLKPLYIEAKRLVELFKDKGININRLTPDLTTEKIRKQKMQFGKSL